MLSLGLQFQRSCGAMFDGDCLGPDVSGVRLFGSLVRGDADYQSDRDILVLVRGSTPHASMQESIRVWREKDYDVSVYTEERYCQMHRNGHLFTWHVFRESKALDLELRPTNAADLIDTLGLPAVYRHASSDGDTLFRLLDASVDNLQEDTCSEVYEAGLLYVIARNLAIIASWQLEHLCFSVHAPYVVGGQVRSPFPLSLSVYDLLRRSRKASAGTLPAPKLSRQELLTWAAAIKTWVSGFYSLISGEQSV